MKRSPKQEKRQKPDLLRAEAEARLALRTPSAAMPRTAEELLHELHVQQIELEMQNEQLRLAQTVLEKSRDRYADLYEFAPVGYLSLTSNGQITEINLAGASLLGLPRKELLKRRFEQFVAPADIERWRRLFIRLKNSGDRLIDELELQPSGCAIVRAELEGQRKAWADGQPPVVRLVLIDLSASRVAAEERRIAAKPENGTSIGEDAAIWQQALTDPLTRLSNRRLMLDRLHHCDSRHLPDKKTWCAIVHRPGQVQDPQ